MLAVLLLAAGEPSLGRQDVAMKPSAKPEKISAYSAAAASFAASTSMEADAYTELKAVLPSNAQAVEGGPHSVRLPKKLAQDRLGASKLRASKHRCDETKLSADDASAWASALTNGCDVQPRENPAVWTSQELPTDATVHVPADSLESFAAALRKLPGSARLTILLSGAEDGRIELPMPSGLLKDDRLVRAFRIVRGGDSSLSAAVQQESREGKLVLLRRDDPFSRRLEEAHPHEAGDTTSDKARTITKVLSQLSAAVANAGAKGGDSDAASGGVAAKQGMGGSSGSTHEKPTASEGSSSGGGEGKSRVSSGLVGGSSGSGTACGSLARSLELLWGTHEGALLKADSTGILLTDYYNSTMNGGWNRSLDDYGDYDYYVRSSGR